MLYIWDVLTMKQLYIISLSGDIMSFIKFRYNQKTIILFSSSLMTNLWVSLVLWCTYSCMYGWCWKALLFYRKNKDLWYRSHVETWTQLLKYSQMTIYFWWIWWLNLIHPAFHVNWGDFYLIWVYPEFHLELQKYRGHFIICSSPFRSPHLRTI